MKLTMKFALICIWLMVAAPAQSAAPPGLLAEWNFDEGRGDVAHDASGNGHDAKLSGAVWVKQGDGFAAYLDGLDDYVDCGSLGIAGPVTFEIWAKPMRKGYGEACLMGESLSSYLLTYYNTEVACWYIGGGGNSVYGKLGVAEWNHIVATFDGKMISEWVNGRVVGNKESKFTTYPTEGRVVIGTKGQPSLPRYKGMVDRVRIYNRALPADEAVGHFKAESAAYGFDPTWFSRVKATPHYYWERGEIVVEADYRGLQPLDGKARIEVTLANKEKPKQIIQQRVIDPLLEGGVMETTLPGKDLASGSYVIRVTLQDSKGARPTEELAFSYPPKPPSIPSPATQTAAMPPASKPNPFGIKVNDGGGFTLTIKGTNYPFQSKISWPRGEFNRLAPTDASYDKGEKSWKVTVQTPGKDRYQVDAAGESYSIRREIEVFPTHVQVKDTYTNTSKDDLGLLIYNELALKPDQVTASWLSGHEGRGRRAELNFPDHSPNVFLTDANTGIGIVPVDDVFIVHALPYVLEDAAGICTERFALAPGASYTLEWAVYPTGSGDYYDYINAFRKVEGRTSTVAGAPGFITYGPNNRRQVPEADFIEKRAIKVGILHCLSNTADDPTLSIEGIEFMDFPKEMQLLKGQAAAIHRQHPGLKVVFHIAHSLYLTDKPDRFADSKAIGEDGKQTVWGASDPYISKKHQDEGWTWWIYYPTPGNSFHDALLKSVDVLMDDLGMDGVFMDGFLAGYISQWTYDGRWDGHSADIDPATKTIRRKIGSVVLLSQPSMIEFARKIRGKGGVVIANNTVFTRSICRERYIIFDNECASGPEMHLAPSATVLAAPPFKSEKDIYLDMLDKLSWGELFLYYNERLHLTYPSLAAREFPMTFEELRSGMVRGKERIVTMNPGVYGWPGERDLHAVYKFDDRGAPVPNEFITTVDGAGVRTELKFAKQESAVIERIPVSLESGKPVNVRVLQYGGSTLKLLLNGQGDAVLNMFVGTFYPDRRVNTVFKDGGTNPADVGVGTDYRVTVGSTTTTIKDKDGMLVVPLKLNGQTEIVIAPADGKGR